MVTQRVTILCFAQACKRFAVKIKDFKTMITLRVIIMREAHACKREALDHAIMREAHACKDC